MKENDLNFFKQVVKKVGKYKPKEKPKKPIIDPSAKEVNTEFVLDKKTIRIVEK